MSDIFQNQRKGVAVPICDHKGLKGGRKEEYLPEVRLEGTEHLEEASSDDSHVVAWKDTSHPRIPGNTESVDFFFALRRFKPIFFSILVHRVTPKPGNFEPPEAEITRSYTVSIYHT